jgi:hypothetical protein
MRQRAPKLSFPDRYTRWEFRRSEHRVFAGVRVAVFWPTGEERDMLFPKLEAAIALLEATAPKYLARLRRNAEGVFLDAMTKSLGQWQASLRLVEINKDWVMRADTAPEDVALTLVHESTHAWLTSLGISYAEPIRARIEHICFLTELAVAPRLPHSERLIAALHRQLARDPSYWTHEAFRERAAQQLIDIGFPKWVVAALKRVARRVPQN